MVQPRAIRTIQWSTRCIVTIPGFSTTTSLWAAVSGVGGPVFTGVVYSTVGWGEALPSFVVRFQGGGTTHFVHDVF